MHATLPIALGAGAGFLLAVLWFDLMFDVQARHLDGPGGDTRLASIAGRGLRPAETTYLFRLAGPPEKYRWSFRLVPEVSDKERQALDLIDPHLPR